MTITKSGELASFYTVNKAPIKHLKVYFSPKQAGEGDPSPENVRAITGWTGLEVYRTGKNLCPAATSTEMYENWVYSESTRHYTIRGLPPEQAMTLQCNLLEDRGQNISNLRLYLRGSNYGFINTATPAGIKSITRNVDTSGNIHISHNNLGLSPTSYNVQFNNVQLEVGSEATQYEPYQGQTITLDWTNEAGTVYGGYVDLVTGELFQTYGDTTLNGTFNPWKLQWSTVIDKDSGETLINTLYYKRDTGDNRHNRLARLYADSMPVNSNYNINTPRISAYDGDTFSICLTLPETISHSLESLNTYLATNPIHVVFELQTPITHQLTPLQLQTLLGHNNIWSNADRVEIEYDLAESNDELYRRRNILLRTPHIETATGSIANFNTDMKAQLKECKVYFNPVQEGEGDPSPENIRPINGWDEIELKYSNINLYDNIIMESGYYKWYIPETLIGSDLIYSMEVDNTNGTNEACIRVIFKDKNGATISRMARTSGIIAGNKSRDAITFSDAMPANTNYIYFGTSGKNTNITNPMIEIRTGSVWDLSQYEPYIGTTIPITFPSETGTVYGGYVDLVSGEVWKTWTKDVLKNIIKSTYVYGSTNVFISGYVADFSDGANVMSSYYPTADKLVPISTVPNMADKTIAVRSAFGTLIVKDTQYSTIEELHAAVGNAEICYKIAQPILVATLVPEELKTLRGTNNIWSNSNGNIEVKYWTH